MLARMWRVDRKTLQVILGTGLVVAWAGYLLTWTARRGGPVPFHILTVQINKGSLFLMIAYTVLVLLLMLCIRFRWRTAGALTVVMAGLFTVGIFFTPSMWLATRFENVTDDEITVHVIALGSHAEMRRTLRPGASAWIVLCEGESKEMVDGGLYYVLAYDSRGEVLYFARKSGQELRKKTIVIGGESEKEAGTL